MATGQLNAVIRHLRADALLHDGGMTDGQLLECFISRRDEVAFAALVRRHGPMVLGVCRRVLRHAQDAEDAFQATFLVLVRKAANLGQPELVGNWLYGTAYRAALEAKAIRQRVRERQVTAMPEPEAVVKADAGHDLRPILDQELSRLPDKYRVPVVLCDLEGRTRREVARQLGIPEGTLSGRLTTARRLLAKRLSRHGLAVSTAALSAVLCPSGASACVSPTLAGTTVKAAALLAAGDTAAGAVSVKVAALTDGVLKALSMGKIKATVVMLAMIGLIAVVSGGAISPRPLARPSSGRLETAAGKPTAIPAAEQEPPPAIAQATGSPRKEGAIFPGTLERVNVEENTVTVKGGTNIRRTGPTEKIFRLAGDVVILRDDKEAGLGDLKPGNRVSVKMSADETTALSISETGKTTPARLKSVDPANGTLTITTENARTGEKKDVTHQVAKDVKVSLRGGKRAGLADLAGGAQVMLTSSADNDRLIVRIGRGGR